MSNPHPADTPYLTVRPSSAARLRLFCFHHAGGSASVFISLRKALGPDINVVPVQLPGRERRVNEPLPTDMAALVADLDQHLDPFLGKPYACYGHSMGALVAHDLAMLRQARGARLPVRLVAGACRAPHLPAAFAAAQADPDDVLLRTMVDIGGLSPELLKYPDWLRVSLSLTRGDLRLCASRTNTRIEPMPYPVDAFYGTTDPLVSEHDAAAWAPHTDAEFRSHSIPGDHFFLIRESSDVFAAKLAEVLAGATQPTSL